MLAETYYAAWPTLVLDRRYTARALDRTEHALSRADFEPGLAAHERALGAKLPDRSPERRN